MMMTIIGILVNVYKATTNLFCNMNDKFICCINFQQKGFNFERKTPDLPRQSDANLAVESLLQLEGFRMEHLSLELKCFS